MPIEIEKWNQTPKEQKTITYKNKYPINVILINANLWQNLQCTIDFCWFRFMQKAKKNKHTQFFTFTCKLNLPQVKIKSKGNELAWAQQHTHTFVSKIAKKKPRRRSTMTPTMFDEMNFGLWLGAFFATFGFVRILISCKMYMEASKYLKLSRLIK